MPPVNQIQQPALRVGAEAVQHQADPAAVPPELQHARSSRAAVFGRVVLGIFTLGISEGIRMIVRSCRRAPADAAPRVGQHQFQGIEQLAGRDDFRHAMEEGFAPFADETDPQMTAAQIVQSLMRDTDFIRLMNTELRHVEAEEGVTPDRLRTITQRLAAPAVGKLVLNQEANVFADAHGIADSSIETRRDLIDRSVRVFLNREASQFDLQMSACQNLTEVRLLVSRMRAPLDERLLRNDAANQVYDEVVESAYNRVAREIGVDVANVRANLAIDKFRDGMARFSQQSIREQIPVDEVKNFFRRNLSEFVGKNLDKRIQLFKSSAELGLPEEFVDYFKSKALSTKLPLDADLFKNCVDVVGKFDAPRLIDDLKNAATPEARLELLRGACLRMQQAVTSHYSMEDWSQKFGADGRGDFFELCTFLLLRSHPELQERLLPDMDVLNELVFSDEQLPFAEEGEALMCLVSNVRQLPTQQQNRAVLVTALEANQLPPAHQAALIRTFNELQQRFPEALSGKNPQELLRLSTGASERSTLLNSLKDDITSGRCGLASDEFARALTRHAEHAVLLGAVRADVHARGRFDEHAAAEISDRILKRFPRAVEGLAAGRSVADVLGGIKYDDVLAAHRALDEAWTHALDNVYARISQALGLDINFLRSNEGLKIDKIGVSGRFGYLRADVWKACSTPKDAVVPEGEVGPEIPTPEQIAEKINGFTDRFVEAKIEQYRCVDRLNVSEEMKASLKNDVLRNPVLNSPNFLENCSLLAQYMGQVNLAEAMRQNAQVITDHIVAMSRMLTKLPESLFGDEFNRMGTDEGGAILNYAMKIYVDSHPEVRRAVLNNRRKIQEVEARLTQGETEAYQNLTREMSVPSLDELAQMAHKSITELTREEMPDDVFPNDAEKQYVLGRHQADVEMFSMAKELITRLLG